MQPLALCLALCLAAAAAAPADHKFIEQEDSQQVKNCELKNTEQMTKNGVPGELAAVQSALSQTLMQELQAKEATTKGFFEELAQISQNIITHAHQAAEQLIQSIEETAHKALQNLQKDRPDTITLKPDPSVVTAVTPPTGLGAGTVVRGDAEPIAATAPSS